MFAAVSTVEPPIVDRQIAMFTERDKTWYEEHLSMINKRIRAQLAQLSAHLRDGDWLDGAFSAADIMMIHVVRRLESSGILQ